jgi:hypothetical protein
MRQARLQNLKVGGRIEIGGRTLPKSNSGILVCGNDVTRNGNHFSFDEF